MSTRRSGEDEPEEAGPSDGADDGGRPGAARRSRPLHPVKRLLLGAAGVVVLVIGVALLVLPGPGLLLVLAGLVLLSRALPAVARFVDPVRTQAMQGVEASVASRWRIAGTALAGLALIGAGVVWGTRALSWLPFAGWSTGSSLILSGLIVLGLLIWSHRRTHRS